jgi:hypothetical protein
MEENIKKIKLKSLMSDSELKTFHYSKNLSELEKIQRKNFEKLNIQTQELKRSRDKEIIEYKKALIEKSELLKKNF